MTTCAVTTRHSWLRMSSGWSWPSWKEVWAGSVFGITLLWAGSVFTITLLWAGSVFTITLLWVGSVFTITLLRVGAISPMYSMHYLHKWTAPHHFPLSAVFSCCERLRSFAILTFCTQLVTRGLLYWSHSTQPVILVS